MEQNTEGQVTNGTQETPVPEKKKAETPISPEQQVAKDKEAADAKLLDGNGNPKSEEAIALEQANDQAKEDATLLKPDERQARVENRAKQVEDLVESAGITTNDLMAQADLETGDISVSHKAKLIEQHGEAIAELVADKVKAMAIDVKKAAVEKNNAVFSQVEEAFKGTTEQKGEETWKELAGWVKENVDKNTRKEYNKMLNEGGMQANMAVKAMVESFKKGNDMTIKADLLEGDGDIPKGDSGGFVTRAEYNTQLQDLLDKGHDYDTSPEVAKLNNKRLKSMKAGK